MIGNRLCWCGSNENRPFSDEYVLCAECGTLISIVGLSDDELKVDDDEGAFYGKQYWLEHQSKDLGFPNIFERARKDLLDRNLHWLRTLLKYKAPPSTVLELGCSHGSFVALLRQSGYDAAGIEMSPWVVEFAKTTFDIPVFVGPVEAVDFGDRKFDVIALMDVLEHLPDPVGTMRLALELLSPGGLLLIQTPQFKEQMRYKTLLETNAPFLEQFKSNEHLYLFTKESVAKLFKQLGAEHIKFEPPIFHQYDMFFVVSRDPISTMTEETAAEILETPSGRFVQALLAQKVEIEKLSDQIKIIDADRDARLQQIHTLTKMIHDLQSVAKT
ncbi:class I SAM-dependent methyltransferase [Rhizobium laguerreae]|uniref:class I SAM-dependent methyltransferase n=1 Tax=Rhizobium laguerreae TaxID=1076926 RepID=UPI001C90C469|nr:class I SAM-dependent methyltransferase [Rhizobium laguerreae]MBY3515014.1 class I SAM-dependent methyltransferase [Rhizobium laguerreae]